MKHTTTNSDDRSKQTNVLRYLRGTTSEVLEQERTSRALLANVDWHDMLTFFDVTNGQQRKRPKYAALKKSMRDGVGNLLLVTDLSILSRRPSEIRRFFKLAEQCGVQIRTPGRGNPVIGSGGTALRK
jgi:DNA invertase Pin-like site-specific DNA recombinase